MKILLVYPQYPATFWSFKYALPFVNKKATLPPLGLLTVATMLPEEWEKRLVDLNVTNLKDKDIQWADYVFISGMIVQKKSAQEIIDRVKTFDKPVIAGGPLFTTGYKDFHDVDSFVLNEGEITVPLFLKDLEQGTLKPLYTTDQLPDISTTPLPSWDLIDYKDYASMAIQISRGCPFNCEFCDVIIMNGRVPRTKGLDQIIAELEAVYNIGWRGSLFIVDDNFIGNKIKVKKILRAIGEWMDRHKKPFTLYTEVSINVADDQELIDLLKAANFNALFIGIETPDEESLQACGKMQNVGKNLLEQVKILQRNGMQVQAGFIVGFDTDNPNIFDRLIKFIQESGIVTAMVGLLTALPKTQLHERLDKEGRLLENPSSGNNVDFSMNFIPKMEQETLLDGYKKVLTTIFSPKHLYERIKTFIKEHQNFATSRSTNVWGLVKGFFVSIWKLGVRCKGKKYFWKLFFWTIFRKPTLMPKALILAVYGYHYRTVLEDCKLNEEI